MKKIIFTILALFATSSIACAATSESATPEVKATSSTTIFVAHSDKDKDTDEDVSPSYKDADRAKIMKIAHSDKDKDSDEDVSPSYKDRESSIG